LQDRNYSIAVLTAEWASRFQSFLTEVGMNQRLASARERGIMDGHHSGHAFTGS
jgi:hypothetical protein